MSLETATYISQLDPENPVGTDGVNQGDDHIRLIKLALQATFPNFTAAALASTNARLDAAVSATVLGTTAAIHFQGALATPGLTFIGDLDTGIYSPGANQLSIVSGGVAAVVVGSDASVNFPVNAKIKGLPVCNVPIGGSIDWWSSGLPAQDGATWTWLNGQAISRTTYATLFGEFGTFYGSGDGSTTFNLPDAREVVTAGVAGMGSTGARGGNFLFGTNPGQSASANVLGFVMGEAGHTTTVSEMPAHAHTGTTATSTVTDPGHVHTIQGNPNTIPAGAFVANGNNGLGNTGNVTTNSATTGITVSTTVSVASQGGGLAHNNVQPTMLCGKIIRIA